MRGVGRFDFDAFGEGEHAGDGREALAEELAPPATGSKLARFNTVVGAGFVCATHKLDSGLPKSRRGSAEPKSRSGSVDNGGGVGRRGTVGFSGRRGSGAGLAPATAPATPT